MSIDYRTIVPEELPAFARADSLAFGKLLNDDDLAIEMAALEYDRAIASFEGDRVVGTTASLSLELTVPGGTRLRTGGLTWTGVIPTHRRRGVLSGMIERQLALSRERGEPASALLASEAGIYGRFGYGPSTWSVGFTIPVAFSAFRAPLRDSVQCRLLDAVEAAVVLPRVFDRHCSMRHGSLGRTAGLWHVLLADPEHHREGAGPLFHVAHEEAGGDLDGYASYRFKPSWGDDGIPQGTLVVTELVAATADAYAALWRYCLDMDLAATVIAKGRASDEPLRWLLADPRQLRTTAVMDFLWLRILDVSACLAARDYAAEGALVLEAHEPNSTSADTPGSDGGPASRRYLLDAGPDGAVCGPTARPADVVLGVAELGAVYLGGTSFTALAQGGRVHEAASGALAKADKLFATALAPWCCTSF
ncbi:MAG: GNAT family N-acetyltransferase [Thermoleophilia bacterium]|nr:GNAT family N-acetyltransferase [Thermoleophilia bacterium]